MKFIKQGKPIKNNMIIAFDYYHTLTDDKRMLQLVKLCFRQGHQIGLISAYGDRQGSQEVYQKRVEKFLRASDIYNLMNFIELVHFNDQKHIARLKLEACKKHKVEVFFDDRLDVCKMLTNEGIMALQFTR